MKENNIKISVIIPTFNREKFICRAIDSVKEQSYIVDEIIVVDNNSTDKTIEIIKNKYKDILVLIENKKGVSYARNYGILKSKNDWVAFLDSDDEWFKNKIKEQVIFIKKNIEKIKLVHCNEIWLRNNIHLNQKKKHKKKGGYIFEDCLDACKISPSSVLINKKLFLKYGGFDSSFQVCEDYELWLRLTSKEEVGYIEEPLVKKFGGHAGQLSCKYWGLDRFRIKALEKLIFKFSLNKYQKKSVIHKILEKIEILIIGARKRNKENFLKIYKKKKSFWINYLNEKNDRRKL